MRTDSNRDWMSFLAETLESGEVERVTIVLIEFENWLVYSFYNSDDQTFRIGPTNGPTYEL